MFIEKKYVALNVIAWTFDTKNYILNPNPLWMFGKAWLYTEGKFKFLQKTKWRHILESSLYKGYSTIYIKKNRNTKEKSRGGGKATLITGAVKFLTASCETKRKKNT